MSFKHFLVFAAALSSAALLSACGQSNGQEKGGKGGPGGGMPAAEYTGGRD